MDPNRNVVEPYRTRGKGLSVEGIVEEDRSALGDGTDHKGAKLLTEGDRDGMVPVHARECEKRDRSCGSPVYHHILDPVSLVGSHHEDLGTSTGNAHISRG
jgi:hypothetical protein